MDIECKICTGTTVPLRHHITGKKYSSCAQCGYIFIDPAAILSPELQRERYLKHDNSMENEGYRKMLENFINNFIIPLGTDVNEILDFGCGPEPVTERLLNSKGYRAYSYDHIFYPSRNLLMKNYDLITMTEVIEHLEHPLKVLSDPAGMINPGGYLALTTLFHPGPENFSGWWYGSDETHISFYTPNTMEVLAKNLKPICCDRDAEPRR